MIDYNHIYNIVLNDVKNGSNVIDAIKKNCGHYSHFYEKITKEQKYVLKSTVLSVRRSVKSVSIQKREEKYKNKKYGRLTVLSFDYKGNGKYGAFFFKCKCDCGVIKTINIKTITRGLTQSCGCYKREIASIVNRKYHKLIVDIPEYSSYSNMITRCYNKNRKQYNDYGGRGISVCDRWVGDSGFSNFLLDMGDRPSLHHSLDRINNDGNYEPSNCRWATADVQSSNKRTSVFISVNGISKTASQWAKIHNMRIGTVLHRMRKGYINEELFTKGVKRYKK